MNVRKQRQHQCGLTNIDFRTKGDIQSLDRFNPTLKYSDMGTMTKTGFKQRLPSDAGLKEKWKTQGGWLSMKKPDPKVEDAVAYYNQTNKTLKELVSLAHVHDQLEREAWTDNIFNGDNVKANAIQAQQAAKRDLALKQGSKNLISTEFGEAMRDKIQSELAKFKVQTLDDAVDLAQIRDIRRALRRKYASRSNIDRIFTQWDSDNKGSISAQDICQGLSKLGIRANLEEAMALQASAKGDGATGDLDFKEFQQLLFSSDDRLNVNLNSIIAPTDDEKLKTFHNITIRKQNKRLDFTQLDSHQLELFRARNTLRYCIQKQIKEIARDLQTLDEQRTFQADPNAFMKVINRRVKAPEALKEHGNMLYDYVLGFQDEQTGKIRYRDMAADILTFNYDKETNEGILPRSSASISSGAYSIPGVKGVKNVFNDEYTVVNAKQVPQNQVEMIEKRLVKLNRVLKGKFPSKDAFQKSLIEKAGADVNGNLNVDDFKSYIVDQCRDELISRQVTKQDIEGFLSAFDYNAYGGTNIKAVAPLVYETDQNKLSTSLAIRVRANPPPFVANQELGSTVGSWNDVDNVQAKRLRDILVKVEDKAFDSKPRFYSVFKQMDVDGDGFISYKDFEAHLIKNKIEASQSEIVTLMHTVLDPERKGYIDFSDFQKRFKPRMSDQITVNENEQHYNKMQPSIDLTQEYGEKQKGLKASITQVNKVFRPDPDTIELIAATRFGAKPAPPNTFLNYQQGPSSPGFVSELDRLGKRSDRTLQTKISFQTEDREKLKQVQEAKIAAKQKRAEDQTARIVMQEQDLLSRDLQKTLRKAQIQDTYDKLCHMGSH